MPKLKFRSKLPRPDDPEILDIIYDNVSQGMPLCHAATLAGVFEGTAYRWERDGTAALNAAMDTANALGNETVEVGSTAAFVVVLKEARANMARDVLAGVRGGERGWQSWAWLGERRDNANFAQTQRTENTHVTITVPALPAAAAPALLAIVRDRLEANTPLLPAADPSADKHDSP